MKRKQSATKTNSAGDRRGIQKASSHACALCKNSKMVTVSVALRFVEALATYDARME